jgi:hypothetical protein
MHLPQSGVDLSVIALRLGHESPATTHTHLEADLAMKENALNHLRPPHNIKEARFKPPDRLPHSLTNLLLFGAQGFAMVPAPPAYLLSWLSRLWNCA